MINFNWYINSIDCYKSKNNLENVVYNVRWIYTGIDDVNNVSWSIDGVTELLEPSEDKFISIEMVDKTILVSWLTDVLDVSNMELEITNKINDIINSNKITIEINQ